MRLLIQKSRGLSWGPSKPPAYDNYRYALYDPDAVADFVLMTHG